jgi:hypothetical protein
LLASPIHPADVVAQTHDTPIDRRRHQAITAAQLGEVRGGKGEVCVEFVAPDRIAKRTVGKTTHFTIEPVLRGHGFEPSEAAAGANTLIRTQVGDLYVGNTYDAVKSTWCSAVVPVPLPPAR